MTFIVWGSRVFGFRFFQPVFGFQYGFQNLWEHLSVCLGVLNTYVSTILTEGLLSVGYVCVTCDLVASIVQPCSFWQNSKNVFLVFF